MSEYPQHDMYSNVSPEIEAVEEFVSWLDEKNIYFRDASGDYLAVAPPAQLIFEYFGIDYDEFWAEKDRMVMAIREPKEKPDA